MKLFTTILLFALAEITFAQVSADRYEVGTGGADAITTTGAHISYTVGGLVVETAATPSLTVTQGFEQPDAEASGTFDGVRPPNAFSPDGDGINDVWIIDLPVNLNGVVDLTIINRWGDQIAFVENYDNSANVWDGTYDATGLPVVAGTYFYMLEADEVGGKKTGWIQVIRNN